MKTNNQIAESLSDKYGDYYDDEGHYCDVGIKVYDAAFEMAQIKDRQFAEKIKAKADKMYAKSQGGGSYDDHADALTIYDYLSDFYTEITGEYL